MSYSLLKTIQISKLKTQIRDKAKEINKLKEKMKLKALSNAEIRNERDAKNQFLREKDEFEEKFYRLMFELGFINKFNDTFDLRILSKAKYGFYAEIYLNEGLSFAGLKEKLTVIEENLQCIWIMNYDKFEKYAKLKIITKPLDLEHEYENPEIKPWEMYLGLDLSLNVNKNNNNKNNMFLMAGATGSGKTRFIYMILLAWIVNCQVNEVELYISDIAKDEYCNLKYIKHVRYYANDLEKLHKMLLYLKIKFEKKKNYYK